MVESVRGFTSGRATCMRGSEAILILIIPRPRVRGKGLRIAGTHGKGLDSMSWLLLLQERMQEVEAAVRP